MWATPEPASFTAAPPIVAALKGLCPRCGSPTLFGGVVSFAKRCRSCDLDLAAFNVGDGPAAFLTLILGTVVVVMAIALELTVAPPLWVHMLIWIPVAAAGVVASLRIAKAALIGAEYRGSLGDVGRR